MKKQRFIAALILASACGFALIFNGCRPPHHGAPEAHFDRLVSHVSDELDLSDQQKKDVERIKKEILAKMKQLEPAHKEIHDALRAEIIRDKVNPDVLKKKAIEREKEMREMRNFMIDKFVEFHQILNPEQRKKLVALIDEHKTRRGKCFH